MMEDIDRTSIREYYILKAENWGDDGQYFIETRKTKKYGYLNGILITHRYQDRKEKLYPKNRIERKLTQEEQNALKQNIMLMKI
ncbi:unnamed protein product [marine sediment metagenome]|uniref:Uncharacterized protein n=1 Tax=marine sediment metagenome TaxID=412755 RepID=X1F2K3_9ZZZZ